MADYVKRPPSGGGANYLPIAVAATVTPGTIFHTADATATDEIWMWASNTTNADIKITVEHGGVAAGNQIIETVPANGSINIVPGVPLTGGNICRAFAAAGLNMWGYVNRIT